MRLKILLSFALLSCVIMSADFEDSHDLVKKYRAVSSSVLPISPRTKFRSKLPSILEGVRGAYSKSSADSFHLKRRQERMGRSREQKCFLIDAVKKHKREKNEMAKRITVLRARNVLLKDELAKMKHEEFFETDFSELLRDHHIKRHCRAAVQDSLDSLMQGL